MGFNPFWITEGAHGVLSAANPKEITKRLERDLENMKKTLHATTKKTKSSSQQADNCTKAISNDTGGRSSRKKAKLAKSLSKKNSKLLSFYEEDDNWKSCIS